MSGPSGEAEATPIYADPSNSKSDQAVGSETAEVGGGGGGQNSGTGGGFGGVGGGPPSATPSLGKVGRVGDGNGGTGLGGLKIGLNVSGLSMLPAAPGMDLGGSGGVRGDVMFEAKDVGASLDQIAREILRHLTQHKLTVVWLFDESGSMKDDQKAIRGKFDRITQELKVHAESMSKKKVTEPLNHAIVSFGAEIHYGIEKPTADIEAIGRGIERIPVDESGTENTMHALDLVIGHYQGIIKKDRKLLIVLVTDESGDDGGYVEEAHQSIVSRGVPIYVMGRQSLFGYSDAHLLYIDPVTKDHYWPTIRRGPETADVELLQWDGLHERWDEQPSGFAPYELARLTKDSGGIYFILPSEENMRVRQREKSYRIADLKEYVPDYKSRMQYVNDRTKSDLRRTLYKIIDMTRKFPYKRDFSIDYAQMVEAANVAGVEATVKLKVLLEMQKTLESLQKNRDREPEKRWQAHYDLILAQTVAYQVKSYEYMACLREMIKTKPVPKAKPTPEMLVYWELHHSQDRKAAQGRDREEVRRGDPPVERGHRPTPPDPLGRPRPGRARPRLRRPALRAPAQPEVQRAGQARAEVLNGPGGHGGWPAYESVRARLGRTSLRIRRVRRRRLRDQTDQRLFQSSAFIDHSTVSPTRPRTEPHSSHWRICSAAPWTQWRRVATGVNSPMQVAGRTCSLRPWVIWIACFIDAPSLPRPRGAKTPARPTGGRTWPRTGRQEDALRDRTDVQKAETFRRPGSAPSVPAHYRSHGPARTVNRSGRPEGSGPERALERGEDLGDRLEAGQRGALGLVLEPGDDLLLGRDDGRVVPAAEIAADLAVGGAGVLAGEEHGEHPGVGRGAGAAVRLQGLGVDLEELADGALDVAQGDRLRGVADRVAQGRLGQVQVEPLAGQHGVGDQAVQGPFQLADAGAEVLGDVRRARRRARRPRAPAPWP